MARCLGRGRWCAVSAGEAENPWRELTGHEVVVDMSSPFVCLGRLESVCDGFLVLTEADLHDLRDTSTTRERYVRDARVHGIHPNRRRTWVSLREVVAITRLAEVATG